MYGLSAVFFLLAACWATVFIHQVKATVCPNDCNGQGVCIADDGGTCDCFPGFHGVDCRHKLCPAGIAWFDFPSADNVAHSDFTECSNMVSSAIKVLN